MQPTEQKRICFDSYAICCFDRKDTKSNPLTRKTAYKRLNINYFKERLVHFKGTVVNTAIKINPGIYQYNSGWNEYVGHGFLNAYAAVIAAMNLSITGPSSFCSSPTAYTISN